MVHLRRPGCQTLEARVAQRLVSLRPSGQERLTFSLGDQRADDLVSLECLEERRLMVARKPWMRNLDNCMGMAVGLPSGQAEPQDYPKQLASAGDVHR